MIFQAVVCVVPMQRPSSIDEMPCLVCGRWYVARNQVVSGSFVEWEMVPAIYEVCLRQALRLNSFLGVPCRHHSRHS